MNSEELKAYEAAVDNCEVLRERLAKYEDSDGKALVVVAPEIAASFPRINLNSPEPLDPFVHCCEHAIYLDRERLHKLLEAAPKPADHNEDVRGMVLVDKHALGTVLQALVSAPHHIRELQVTRTPTELFASNPINVLIANYEAAPKESGE